MPALDLARLDLAPDHLALVQTLLRQHVPDADVWAYGSRVSGGAQECSDLDLVLRQAANLSQPTPGRIDLQQALQDSLLPILVEIHDWAGLPGSFQAEIERGYVVVQAGDGGEDQLQHIGNDPKPLHDRRQN